MKVLILCTGNTCRSQIAEAFLRSFNPSFEVYSAGTDPESAVNPNAIRVMKEVGIDISSNMPKLVDKFTDQEFDYVFTVCDNANEKCPFFTGKVNHRIHQHFEDPAAAKGTEEEKLVVYRKVRDQLKEYFLRFSESLQ
jgi:arsenate reductase (thioredoxin)